MSLHLMEEQKQLLEEQLKEVERNGIICIELITVV